MLLFIDCSNGIGGDRLVAALLDLSGARPGARGPLDKVVRPALKAAGIDPRLATVESVRRDGVAALALGVADAPGFASFDELVVSMYASDVGQAHADAVAAVADRLRAAERAVHGEDDERRHELSGVRTAVELIAAAALIHELAPERIVASPPALYASGGALQTAEAAKAAAVVLQLLHGVPLADERPAEPRGEAEGTPAADEEGAATRDERARGHDSEGERAAAGDEGVAAADAGERSTPTTPAGAALLVHFADEYGPRPAGRVAGEGRGAGRSPEPDRADVVRVSLVEPEEPPVAGGAEAGAATEGGVAARASGPSPGLALDDHVVLETNIDDMSAELLAHAAEALREAGALDVWMTPALMKKGRPGTVLHVLAAAGDRERLAGLVFAETTTFGVRVVPVGRLYAEERRETVRLAGQDVGVRLAYVGGRLATVSPEYEDCRRAAAELGRPARVVYEAAQALARSRFSGA